MRTLASLLLALASVALPASATAQNSHRGRTPSSPASILKKQDRNAWEGTYEFSEGGGRSAGAGMIVTHTLVVHGRGGALLCELDADGYQTSRSLRCDAREEGDKLNLYFHSYREGNASAQYKKGQLLLTLERTTVRGKPRLLTHWGAYQPALSSARSGRVYFKKAK
jgi:hypothetical protein